MVSSAVSEAIGLLADGLNLLQDEIRATHPVSHPQMQRLIHLRSTLRVLAEQLECPEALDYPQDPHWISDSPLIPSLD